MFTSVFLHKAQSIWQSQSMTLTFRLDLLSLPHWPLGELLPSCIESNSVGRVRPEAGIGTLCWSHNRPGFFFAHDLLDFASQTSQYSLVVRASDVYRDESFGGKAGHS